MRVVVSPKWYDVQRQEESTVGQHTHCAMEVQPMLAAYPIHAALPQRIWNAPSGSMPTSWDYFRKAKDQMVCSTGAVAPRSFWSFPLEEVPAEPIPR